MAASVITRASLVDNVTLWSAATVNSAVYDAIDSMFGGAGSYTTFEFGGALKVTGALTPVTNDGAAIGSGTVSWADLFLASGGVVNFNNGDVTVTHSTNTLTFDGAASGYIFNNGAVGIGMTPTYRLDVTGSAGFVVARFNQATAGKTGVLFAENGTQRAFLSQVGLYSGNSDGNFGIFVETGYNFQIATNGSTTAKLTVDTGGNVGIGVTPKTFTSGKAVEIGAAGNIAWGNGGGDMFLASNLYYNADFKYAATNAIAAMRLQDGVVKFLTAPSGTADTTATLTERFRVLNGGNIAIGATARIYLDGVAGTGDTYIYEESGNQITFVTGGTGRLYIDTATVGPRSDNNISSGSNVLRWSVVYAANGTIQTSDRTLKRNISTDTLGLDFVQKLRPVSFTMHDEADGTRRHGLIAQEVIEAADGQSLLGILMGEKDGEYGLNYAGFVPALIAAIQQQQHEINALKARIY